MPYRNTRPSARPLFQRRQYQFIADAIAHARAIADLRIDPFAIDRLDAFASDMADRLESTNLHFNRARFLDACRRED